jgi:hypothetical protein
MATPASAGAALLIRQYFMSTGSSFWAGVCNKEYAQCKPFTPSGVLVKALMIASGSTMSLYHGGGAKDVPLGAPPDFMQGYGRVTLSNVLPLKGVYTGFDLYVDDQRSITADQAIVYTVSVASNKVPLK